MDSTVLSLLEQYPDNFRFKGSRPGESEYTKINELALVGDSVLSLQVRSGLIKRGYSASQISCVFPRILSNAALVERAFALGLIAHKHYATHASGTLLEALVGYWYLACEQPDAKERIFTPWLPAFYQLFEEMVNDADKYIRQSQGIDSLFRF